MRSIFSLFTELTAGGSNDADMATPTNEPEKKRQ